MLSDLLIYAIPAAGAAILLLRNKKTTPVPTKIFCIPNQRNKAILDRCLGLRYFTPTWWLSSTHAQTVFASAFRRGPKNPPPLIAEVLVSPLDGAKFAVHWTSKIAGRPTIVVIHGLTGSVDSSYIQSFITLADSRQFQVCAIEARGCGSTASPLNVARGFCATFTSDVRYAVDEARKTVGESTPLFVVGYSLGAGILIKYLSEEGEKTKVNGGAALCCSFDFNQSAELLESGINLYLYNYSLCNNLKKWLVSNRAPFDAAASVDIEAALKTKTIRQFDAIMPVKVFNYKDTTDYYNDASNGPDRLARVATPLLCISALDDPICSGSGIPYSAFESNPNLLLCATEGGGHVAWVSDPEPTRPMWADSQVLDYFSALMEVK